MKHCKLIIVTILIGMVLVATSCRSERSYSSFCDKVAQISETDSGTHLAIYLDVRACLSCCEDMEAWQHMEIELAAAGVGFSLWAPQEDSVDVAVAMELEGLTTPVRVLSREILKELNWGKATPPIKVLFDNRCQPVKVLGPATGATDSRRVIDELLAELLPEGNVDSTGTPAH